MAVYQPIARLLSSYRVIHRIKGEGGELIAPVTPAPAANIAIARNDRFVCFPAVFIHADDSLENAHKYQ